MVLVRNDGQLLPVDPHGVGRVAVLGRLAAMRNLGDGGSSDVRASNVVTPLEGIRRAFVDSEVVHADADASIVDGADLVVVVVGYTKDDEGEYIDDEGTGVLVADLFPPMDHPELGVDAPYVAPAPSGRVVAAAAGGSGRPAGSDDARMAPGGDRVSLRLSSTDEALIAAAAERHDRVVVVVVTGSAVVMPWVESVPATLVSWYSGVEGGSALGDVVTGRAEPGGRLPFAIPTDPDHLVAFDRNATAATYDLFHGQWKLDRDGHPAQFPFGWGLSYADVSVVAADLAEDGGSVRVRVANRSDRETSTVVFVHAGLDDSNVERPHRRLVGLRPHCDARSRGGRGRDRARLVGARSASRRCLGDRARGVHARGGSPRP